VLAILLLIRETSLINKEVVMMGQNEMVTAAGSSTLRHMLLVLLVAALMAAMLVATAIPAMADSQKNGGPGHPITTGDLDGQGRGSDAFHNDDGICVSHVGGCKVAGTSNGRGC
jgi:hypothetical protein